MAEGGLEPGGFDSEACLPFLPRASSAAATSVSVSPVPCQDTLQEGLSLSRLPGNRDTSAGSTPAVEKLPGRHLLCAP